MPKGRNLIAVLGYSLVMIKAVILKFIYLDSATKSGASGKFRSNQNVLPAPG